MAITPSSRPSTTPGGSSYGSSTSSSSSSSRPSSSSSSGGSGTTTSSTGQTFQNVTTGPYTLQAAQSTGYVQPSSYTSPTPVAPPKPFVISAPAIAAPPGKPSITLGGASYSHSSIPNVSFTSMSALNDALSTGVIKPGTTYNNISGATYNNIPTIPANTKNTVSDYSKMFGSSGGDISAYRSAVGYEKLTANQKKIADKTFEAKKKKEDEEKKKPGMPEIDTKALVETPEQEKQRLAKEAAEQAKINAEEERKAALIAKNQEMEALNTQYDTNIGEEQAASDQYTAQETESAAKFEENRLNQVRGDIMQNLALRGLDISKLAPEQITALSGEQGVKAFTDIYSVKEKAKSNIKAARDNAMAKIQTLRANKNISQAAYNTQVNNINALTNQKLLEADNNYKNAVVSLIDKKIETAGSVSTTLYNALTGMGIPASSMNAFAGILTSSNSVGDAISKMITSTDPKVQAAYKANEARIKAAAEAENALKLAQINANSASQKDPVDVMIKQFQDQAAREYALGNTAGAKYAAEQANALIATKMVTPGTPSGGAGTSAP